MSHWLQSNTGLALTIAALAVAMAIVAVSNRSDHDPVFTCSAGRHFDMRYVDRVATLGCFE